jgi:hypothetical protein
METDFYTRLAQLQNELKAPKGQRNTFGKYNYRSCEDILEAVKPLLVKYGMVLVLSDSVELIGERYYIEASADLIDTATAKNMMHSTAYAREPDEKKGMDDSQITGTASSYARKYALNGLFLIDDTKDADTDEHRQETAEKPVVCSRCGKAIQGQVNRKTGQAFTPAQVAKTCGGMCPDCYRESKAVK